MCCLKCKKELPIVNKHFNLCRECNNERLYGSKYGKVYKIKQKPLKFNKTPKKPKKFRNKNKVKPKKSLFVKELKDKDELLMVERDEIFYEKCFNLSNHKCEECGDSLPDQFRSGDGKVLARFRYSHIIPKSIASHLRHVIKNINHLCQLCHTRWDFGDKENMKIYSSNSKKFPNYF